MRAFRSGTDRLSRCEKHTGGAGGCGALDASASASDAQVRASPRPHFSGPFETTNPLAGSLSPPTAAVTNPVPSVAPVPRPALGQIPANGWCSERREAALVLTADEATNTLIAVGEPRVFPAQLENLLQLLDVRQPQVMLEVMLISVNDWIP